MTEHTPTPWGTDDPYIVYAQVGDDIVCLAKTYDDLDTAYPVAVADAAFIVKACNAHDELVAAVKPFAKLGGIILAEAPADAKTIVMFTSASGEQFSMQLEYFRSAIAALAKVSS
jgi:hypothetical protein